MFSSSILRSRLTKSQRVAITRPLVILTKLGLKSPFYNPRSELVSAFLASDKTGVPPKWRRSWWFPLKSTPSRAPIFTAGPASARDREEMRTCRGRLGFPPLRQRFGVDRPRASERRGGWSQLSGQVSKGGFQRRFRKGCGAVGDSRAFFGYETSEDMVCCAQPRFQGLGELFNPRIARLTFNLFLHFPCQSPALSWLYKQLEDASSH